MDKNTKHTSVFRVKDIDLLAFLFNRGFKPLRGPVEDSSEIRWAEFQQSEELREAAVAFVAGNSESALLRDLRRARSFLLNNATVRETTGNVKAAGGFRHGVS